MTRDFAAYERELERMKEQDKKRRSSSGGDFVWLETNKPSRAGDQNRQRLRLVPRSDGNGGTFDEFWLSIDQHMVKVDGKMRALVCPNDPDDDGAPEVCPLCKLSKELYTSRNSEWLGMAKEMNSKTRIFANVIDLDDKDHPEAPKVWGFSRTILHALLDICMAKRSFLEDPEVGRDLLLTTRRIGPARFDIRYSVTDLDSAPIDPAFAKLADLGHSLEGLAKPANMDDLHEIAANCDPRGGSKRAVEPVTAVTPTPEPVMAAPATPEPTNGAEAAVAPPMPPVAGNATVYHYSGPSGQQEGLSAADVAALVHADEKEVHHVWTEGMSGWAEAESDAEVLVEVAKLREPKKSAGPPPPPAGKGGPPVPPTPKAGKAF